MRVALVGTLPTAGRAAHRGPERTTIGLAEALADRGHEVLVVADEGDPETVATDAHVVGRDLRPGIDRLVGFYRRVDAAIDRDAVDVVHAWRPAPADLFSIHGIRSAATAERRCPGTFSRIDRLGERAELLGKRWTARRADRTAVTAVANAVDAAANGIRPDRSIPVGVQSSFLQESVQREGQPTVLCVGRVEPYKNQAFVADHLPDGFDLRLVGPQTHGDYAAQVRDFEDRWVGTIPDDELRREYAAADVFVLPSVFEGFGLTAVEAMAAGTPVVVADSCGIAEHVYDAPIGGVYALDDPGSFRRQLRAVADDAGGYGDNARKYVREHLTWPVIAAQYEREYERVVASREDHGAD